MKKIFLTLLLVTTVAQAETYTWTDNEGTIHFSDSPQSPAQARQTSKPPGVKSKTEPASGSAAATPSRLASDAPGTVTPDMETLKGRMLNDEGTMALIRSLQNEPEMQAILNDPEFLRAIQAGDVSVLTSNPAFQKLLNNPRIREIENRVQQNGAR